MANEADNPELSADAAEGATDTPGAESAPAKKSAAKKPAARKKAAAKKTAAKAAPKKAAAKKVGPKKVDVKGLAEVLAASEIEAKAEDTAPAAAKSTPSAGIARPIAVKAVAAKAKAMGRDAKKQERGDFAGPAASATFMGSVSKRNITDFLRQLIMLLKAGTPILRSLQTLSKRSENPKARALVADITQYVEAGNPLWQAFDRHSRYFDRVFVNLIKASEASGTLVIVLERMVAYRTERELMHKRVRSAMIYPFILVIACTLVTLLITWYVIPEFRGMFEKADIEIPKITTQLFALSDIFAVIWWVPFVVIFALFIVYRYFLSKSPLTRRWVDTVKLRLPIIGPIIKGGALVELTRTLALLIRSGVPMMATLELTRSAVNNRRVAEALQGVRDSVERGGGMEAPLRKAAPAIPHVVTDMLVTGEESGKVDEVSDQIADIYEKEVEILTRGLGEALQPIFTLIIGVGIMLLFIALFYPLVSLIEQLGNAGA